tara:strand:+ start:604 stop:1377 length:774 start_codon:yes stop_codon:yes gene_type:complete
MGSSSSQLNNNNQLNELHNKFQQLDVCDAECQKKRKLKQLKNTYTNAKNLFRNAPIRLKSAEKAYYTELKGDQYYSTIQEKKYTKKAQEQVEKWDNDLLQYFLQLDNQIGYFNTQYIYGNNIENVYKNQLNKLKNIRQKIAKTISKKHVNDRIGYFYDYNTSVVNSIIYYMKIVYWVLFSIMILIFLYKKQYQHFDFYPFIISMSLFPFILNYFFSFLINNFKYFTINNFYLIFLILFVIIILLFEKMSTNPFNSDK